MYIEAVVKAVIALVAMIVINAHIGAMELLKNPLVVVLEAVEKPGNLGAILRSADASGVDAVIVCDPLTDMYNPNLIRSSIGAIFTVPTATASSATNSQLFSAPTIYSLFTIHIMPIMQNSTAIFLMLITIPFHFSFAIYAKTALSIKPFAPIPNIALR